MKQHHILITIIIFIFITFHGSSYAMEYTDTTDTVIEINEQFEQEQTGWFNSLLKPFNELLTSLHFQLWTRLEEDSIVQILEQNSFNKKEHKQLLNDTLLESIQLNQIEKIINIITLVHQKFPQDSTLIKTNTARQIHNCITDYQHDYLLTMNHYICNAQTEIPSTLNTQLNLIKKYLQYSIDILDTYKKNYDQKLTNFCNSYNECKQTTLKLHSISDIDIKEQISLNYCSDFDEKSKIHSIENYTNDCIIKKIQNIQKCTKMIQNVESILLELNKTKTNILTYSDK